MTHQKKIRLRRGIIGIIGSLLLSLIWNQTFISKKLEQLSLDYRQSTLRQKTYPSDKVIYVDIDEKTLKTFEPLLGRWPWPRSIYKDVVEHINSGEPKAIIFDILFSGEQKGSDSDLIFSEVSANSKNLSHAIQLLPDSSFEGKDFIPLPSDYKERFKLNWRNNADEIFLKEKQRKMKEYHDIAFPNSILYKKASKIHSVNAEKDDDGIFRHMSLLFYYDKVWIPSLSLSGILSFLDNPILDYESNFLVVYDNNTLKWKIPLNVEGKLPLLFYKNSEYFKIYPFGVILENAGKILKGEVEDPSLLSPNPFVDFKDKVVIIGASAMALEDLKATPVSSNYPGALLHATAISNILDGSFLKEVPSFLMVLVIFFLTMISYFSVFHFENILVKSFLPAVSIGLYIVLTLFLFEKFHIHLQLISPAMFGLLAFIDGFIYMTFIPAYPVAT